MCILGHISGGCIGSPGVLNDVCVVVECQWVMYWTKRPLIGSIRIRCYLGEEFLEPWFGGVELERKMITKRSGKSWGIYSSPHVRMEYIAANLYFILKINPVAYGCKLQGFPTVPQFAISRSDDVCVFTGINWSVWQPKSHDCHI